MLARIELHAARPDDRAEQAADDPRDASTPQEDLCVAGQAEQCANKAGKRQADSTAPAAGQVEHGTAGHERQRRAHQRNAQRCAAQHPRPSADRFATPQPQAQDQPDRCHQHDRQATQHQQQIGQIAANRSQQVAHRATRRRVQRRIATAVGADRDHRQQGKDKQHNRADQRPAAPCPCLHRIAPLHRLRPARHIPPQCS